MRVLITGAAGFIGSNLFNRCLEAGWEAIGIDDMSNGHSEFVNDKSKLFVTDFAASEVLQSIKSDEFEYVFHLAANPRVEYSVQYPVETNENNVSKTLKLIDACKGHVKRFIFSSTSAVYGDVPTLPTPEGIEKNTNSPYGLQKLIIENYLKLYHKLYGLDSISLRYFNVYGRNQIGGSPYSTAVSAWLTAIFSGKQLRLDGTGEQTRDMCHVDDVVNANIQSAIRVGQCRGSVINVGSGTSISCNQILEMLTNEFGKLDIINAPPRKGDVMHTLADVSHARELIAYEPRVSFQDGVKDTINWYKRTFNGG